MTNGSSPPDAQEALYSRLREEMIQTQIVARGIRDPRVIEALRRIPRHAFVEEALRSRAYDDGPLPIGESQTISQPYIVALMLEGLALTGEESALEIGTGSGYLAALLSRLCRRVFSVERRSSLASRAGRLLARLECYNVQIRSGDGTRGWPSEAPFDAIVVSAAGDRVPDPLKNQLKEGGCLILPVGAEQDQKLLKLVKGPAGWAQTSLCDCQFVKLIGEYAWPE